MNMLRLESYLSPFLLSYLSKYIKDIEPQNFNLSLWGGDAILHNVRFKLNALDNELFGAPFSFVSCQAQELRLHVPWSKLASEPVVITLNTVECVLKLECSKPHKKQKKEEPKAETQPQPSYVDNLMNKIKNNVNIVVNNLILKYIEDDIVLSVNVQTADYHGADENWSSAFIDMNEKSSVLRHVFNLKDLTVCLDKRGTSGRIESYEDPLVFRTHIVLRKHASYPLPTSRTPFATKYNIMMERYELTIGEKQLPSFVRLLQLCLHIYYGTILITRTEGSTEVEDESNNESGQGWASWAWSYVPAIAAQDDLDNPIVKNPIIAFGLYIKNVIIKFKPAKSTISGNMRRQVHLENPTLFQINVQGFSLELVAKGLEFFSCDTVICSGSAVCSPVLPLTPGMGSDDERNILLGFSKGSMIGFAANSLFDFRSPENNDSHFEYVLTKDSYFSRPSISAEEKSFVALYLYIASDGRNADLAEEQEFNDILHQVSLTDISEWNAVRERSWKKFIIGGEQSKLLIGSHFVSSLDILKHWATNHTFKSYPLVQKCHINRPDTLNEIKILHFIPTRHAVVSVKNVTLIFPALHLQTTMKPKTYNRIDYWATGTATQSHLHNKATNAKLPCLIVKFNNANFTMKQPMYARHLAAYLSLFHSPPPKLMQTCNTCYAIEINALEICLGSIVAQPLEEVNFNSLSSTICKTSQVVVESYVLQGNEYWKERLSMLNKQTKFKLQKLTINATPGQLQIILHITDSWSQLIQSNKEGNEVMDVCCLDNIFTATENNILSAQFGHVIVECNQSFASTSVLSSLKSVHVFWQIHGSSKVALVKGTSPAIGQLGSIDEAEDKCHEVSNWFTVYLQIPESSQQNGCILIHSHCLIVTLDNLVWDILADLPSLSPKQLLPVFMSPYLTDVNVNAETSLLTSSSKFRYVVQLHCEGIKVHIPCIQSTVKLVQTSQHGLHICLPKTTLFTSGQKRVRITPELITNGMAVNTYTEFGTFNVAMEKAELFTVLQRKHGETLHHIANAYSATCRLVVSPPKTEHASSSIAIHLDVEPIEIKISKPQIELLVEIAHKVFQTLVSIQSNCMLPFIFQNQVNPEVDVSNQSDTQGNTQLKDDSKSNLSALVVKNNPTQVKCTVWLQCTLSRFSFSIYNVNKGKTTLTVEDVSLSLDYTNIYLKLMSCCSNSEILHFHKVSGEWQDAHALGVSLTQMYSKYPMFVHNYPIKESNASKEQSETPKHRKFLEVTYTKALTTDYQRHLNDDESVDLPNSAKSEPLPTNLKNCVSEIIFSVQAFDFLVEPGIIYELLPVFSPFIKIFAESGVSKSATQSPKSIDFPVLYFKLEGVRLFFPCLDNASNAGCDNMLLLFLNKLEVNPYPLNALTRLVLAPSIYHKANMAGLLHTIGSPLEDKQLEITLQDLSVGTAKKIDIYSHMTKPIPHDNPALLWNLTGKSDVVDEPVFHPIVQDFDFQTTVAPSIWYQNKLKKWIIVCGPSFEASFSSDVTLHFTKIQLEVLQSLTENWMQDCTSSLSKSKEVYKTPKLSHNDSGLSMAESSVTREKPVVSVSTSLIGDGLIAAHNIKIVVYKYVPGSNDREVKPLFCILFCEPSVVIHISRTQQRLEVQLHDLSIYLPNDETIKASLVHEKSCFSRNVFQTLPGDSDRRTGVPSSFATVTLQHFLSNKAIIKAMVGRPVKVNLSENLANVLHNITDDFIPKTEVHQTYVSTGNGPSTLKLFSSISLETNQVVAEVNCALNSLRCSLDGLTVNAHCSLNNIDAHGEVQNLAIQMQLSKKSDFTPLVYPVTLIASCHLQKLSNDFHLLYKTDFHITKLKTSISKSVIEAVLSIYQDLLKWSGMVAQKNKSTHFQVTSSSSSFAQDVSVSNSDELRTGSYTYIVSNKQEPTSNQIVFSDNEEKSYMSWCYSKPNAIRHVHITPVPFTSSHLGNTLLCGLEYFDHATQSYVQIKKFELSESDEVEFNLFDDFTPFHKVISSSKWRVAIENTDSCKISIMTLAAAMQVESIFNTRFVPNFTMQFNLDGLNAAYIDSGLECICFQVNNINAAIRIWNHGQDVLGVIDSTLSLSINVVDISNLTCLPVFPLQFYSMHAKKDTESIDMTCTSKSNVVEIRVSQKIIHTLSYLLSNLTEDVPNQGTTCLEVKNNTVKAILFGQALTDECLSLDPGETVPYTWRSHKVDTKLHVSLEGVPDWIWSDSFSAIGEEVLLCTVDQVNGLVIEKKFSGPTKNFLVFNGQTRVTNQLPLNIQCQIMFLDDSREEYALQSNESFDFLWELASVSTVSFKVLGTNYDPKKLSISNLVKTNGNTVSIKFPNEVKDTIYCQACYYRDGLTSRITLVPHFCVRSHLPKPSYLHVETRSKGESYIVNILGRGTELPLLQLSPYITHHLTIQVNQNQSPFDSKIPIHGSLVYSMDETHDLSQPIRKLENNFPYNDRSYNDSSSDVWSAGDGNIHANLSLFNNSLLVEITPWCLIANETSEVLCLISAGNAITIIQPGNIEVPHHFNSSFRLQVSNSCCSEKLYLIGNSISDHPARMKSLKHGEILPNSIHNVLIRKQKTILDLTLSSCVRHGILILTISPTWWFLNNTETVSHLRVKGCVNQNEELICDLGSALEVNNKSPIPLLAWQIESQQTLIAQEVLEEAGENVVSSADESSSSFICVENAGNSSSLSSYFTDRSVYCYVNESSAAVSVKDSFVKRIVNFQGSSDDAQVTKFLFTQHSEDDHLYLVLSDITCYRYKIHNDTVCHLCFREVTDEVTSSAIHSISPGQYVAFESYMDAESFPRCRRVNKSIKLQFALEGENNWVDFLVSDFNYTDKFVIPGLGFKHVTVSKQASCISIKIHEDEEKHPVSEVDQMDRMSLNLSLDLKEVKLVMVDDASNASLPTDVVHICLSELAFSALSDPLSKSWYIVLSLSEFQLDNKLFLAPDFPVFLWSCPTYSTNNLNKALLFNVTLTECFLLDSVDIALGAIQLKLEGSFAGTLSLLLQSYLESVQSFMPQLPHDENLISPSLKSEIFTVTHPIRFSSLTVHPFVVLLSLRADVKVYVSVDRGAISFSKFVCCDVDTTVNELVQELSRHYFADAVFGAGWVLGSLDILGNPATTLRSFAQGVTDLIVMPYQGLSRGPTAFIGGFAHGVSSLLKHFSSGTLRSITNIASGISRNLEPANQSLQHSAVTASFKHSLKNESEEKEKQGYTKVVGKALVKVVTKPIGGAAGLLSKVGESILLKAGLEVHKAVRYKTKEKPLKEFLNSASKYYHKIICKEQGKRNLPVLATLDVQMFSSVGVDFKAELFLTSENLYILRSDDDRLENTFPVKDIELFTEADDQEVMAGVLTIQHVLSVSTEKVSVYKEKVAEYLGVEDHLKKDSAQQTKDIVKYTASANLLTEAALFCAIFDKVKPKSNRFLW